MPRFATASRPIPPARRTSAGGSRRLEPPYDRVDAILITHWHEDHFSAEAIAAHLSANPRATVISSPEVIDRLRRVAPIVPPSRLRALLPAPGQSDADSHRRRAGACASHPPQPNPAAARAARRISHRRPPHGPARRRRRSGGRQLRLAGDAAAGRCRAAALLVRADRQQPALCRRLHRPTAASSRCICRSRNAAR